MKTKDEIKHEIYELAQKISRASSEKFLLESAREIYELVALLKHAPKDEAQTAPKQEEKIATPGEEPVRSAPQTPVAEHKQATIDLFSTEETTIAPIPTEEAVKVSPTAIAGGEQSPFEEAKPAPKEPKTPKKLSETKSALGGKKEESVAEKLQHNKITDLKASIGINEKFQFINELFEGNMKEYNVAVDQINSFASHAEAESYIANLEDIYKWQPDNHIAEHFKELVERRFA